MISPDPRVLTIAGFDPSGGAGVLADMRTFATFELPASAVITSITFQNDARVFGAVHQTAEAVRAQVLPLLESFSFASTKTGMLPTQEVVAEVARLFRETDLPSPVVDPVITSSSGQPLMEEGALEVMISELLPLARLLTPNIPEAERLAGIKITSEEDMRAAAMRIRELGARSVLIKGGHLKREAEGSRQKAEDRERAVPAAYVDDASRALTEEAIDVLDDDGTVTVFREQRVTGGELHGSGCILSAAIAAGLGKGMKLVDSIGDAKKFVLEAIRRNQQVAREEV
jgi:hydroxymethylpyrimidine kinase/phosphomethylpyrimidine kinase